MSLGHSLNTKSSPLESAGLRMPWQYHVRPALFVTVTAIVSILLAVGGLFLIRRLTGALNTEMSPSLMLFLALASTATLSFSRIAWRRNFPLETPADLSPADKVLGWASSAALLMLAVGCCFPANRTADWLIWLPVLMADQFWRQNFFDAGEPWTNEDDDAFDNQEFDNLFATPKLADETIAPTAIANSPQNPELKNIVQQLYRVQDDDGLEVIYGTLRADFVAGQRTAVIHAGFCPPLSYLPEIEAEALTDLNCQTDTPSTAKIKVVQSFAHGTRLDIRLAKVAPADCQVWIDMAARPMAAQEESKSVG